MTLGLTSWTSPSIKGPIRKNCIDGASLTSYANHKILCIVLKLLSTKTLGPCEPCEHLSDSEEAGANRLFPWAGLTTRSDRALQGKQGIEVTVSLSLIHDLAVSMMSCAEVLGFQRRRHLVRLGRGLTYHHESSTKCRSKGLYTTVYTPLETLNLTYGQLYMRAQTAADNING